MEAPRTLEHLPEIGQRVLEFDEFDQVRELFVKPVRMLYIIRGDFCYIAYLVHATRDLTSSLTLEELENL